MAKKEEQEEHHGFGAIKLPGNTTCNNCIARKHKQEIYHNFDYFLKKHEQVEHHPKV